MVPSKVASDLRSSYEILLSLAVNVNGYDGRLTDVACDLATYDSFVAGVASRILERDRITIQERAVLRHPVLIGSRWSGHLVSCAELSNIPELLNWAQRIDATRILCLEAAPE